MAKIVEVQLPDGRWVIRTSDTISEEELNYPMRCCWINKKGQPCHAPMVAERHMNRVHFRQKNGEKVHILGCVHDERRKKETITHLDRRAYGHEPIDVWKAMKTEKKRRAPQNGGDDTGGGSIGGVDVPGGSEPNPRLIQRRETLPKSPVMLAEVLLELSIDADFANTRVGDLIVDHRTINDFRRDGIPDGAFVLVLAKRLAVSNRTFVAPKDEFVLVDCMYDASKEAIPYNYMQFRLNLTGDARDSMFKYLKLKGHNTFIVIFSRWKKDPDNMNTYIARDVDDDHIGRIRLPEVDD